MEKKTGKPFTFKFEWNKNNSWPEIPDGKDDIIVEILPPFNESPEDILNTIEDSASSYVENVVVTSFIEMVIDVMDASGYNYRIVDPVKPIRTILV